MALAATRPCLPLFEQFCLGVHVSGLLTSGMSPSLKIPSFSPCRRLRLLALACLAPAFCFGALHWDTQKIELTAKSGDKEAVGIFRFANSGNAPVTITTIQPSCGCTTAELAKRTYAPGETGEIKAVFTLGDRVGVQEKSIHVATDEASGKPVSLILRVVIPELFTYTPRVLVWKSEDGQSQKESVISVLGPHKITAIEVKAVTPAAATTQIETIEPGTKYRLLVRPDSPAKPVTVTISCVATFADGMTQTFAIYALVR